MKKITLTPQEYFEFIKIAKFKFDATVSHGKVIVTSTIASLNLIGF